MEALEAAEAFIPCAASVLKHGQDRKRIHALVLRWAEAWRGPKRRLTLTSSGHGVFLHFDQLIGKIWSEAFTFCATPRGGVFLKGPDPDRARKGHKLRADKLDTTGLDALYEAWAQHPEARPAGVRVLEFQLEEVPDDTWEACLQAVLATLGSVAS